MKSILVIGGAGYIGSHVARAFLSAGYKVTVLDNLSSGQQINLFEEADFIHGDLQDRKALDDIFKTPYDGVIHLAALKAANESMLVPERYARQNLGGAVNLLEAMANNRTRVVIFSSTAAVYGIPEQLPMDENHPLAPINFYGFTKLEIERLLDWFDRLKNIRFAALRYFNAAGYDPEGRITGLERNPANLIPIVMETAVGLKKSMSVYGDGYPTPDGTCIRDYIHVSDLADAHLRAFEYAAENDLSLTLNLGTGRGYSVLEVIETAARITGRKIRFDIAGRREGDPAVIYAHSKEALRLLGWQPQFSDLDTIIATTWNVYRKRWGL